MTASLRADLSLMQQAALAGGALLRDAFGTKVKIWSKGEAGPVTEVDLAIDALLKTWLCAQRPDYGWLSEESEDDLARCRRRRVFVVDPIDGTSAFIKAKPECVISIGLVEDGQAVGGVIYNPITQELFEGARDAPARRNGVLIKVSQRSWLEGATLLGRPSLFEGDHWPRPWPPVTASFRHSIAYRLCGVAEGSADGGFFLGYRHEWDVAAGVAIVAAAGGVLSDPWGGPLAFNQPDPRAPGLVAAGPALHPLLAERLSHTPHPKDWQSPSAQPRRQERAP